MHPFLLDFWRQFGGAWKVDVFESMAERASRWLEADQSADESSTLAAAQSWFRLFGSPTVRQLGNICRVLKRHWCSSELQTKLRVYRSFIPKLMRDGGGGRFYALMADNFTGGKNLDLLVVSIYAS